MTQLFVSFSYIGREDLSQYLSTSITDFSNMVIDEPTNDELKDYTFVEYLHSKANDHVLEHLGMAVTTSTILWWKKLNE